MEGRYNDSLLLQLGMHRALCIWCNNAWFLNFISMLCRAILEPVYLLGMKYLRLITGAWSAEMEIPENCILFALIGARLNTQKVEIHEGCILLVLIVVEGLLGRRKYTRNVFCLPPYVQSLVSRWKYKRNVFCLCRDCTRDRGRGRVMRAPVVRSKQAD